MKQLNLLSWTLIVIFPTLFCNSFCFGQDKEYIDNVNSIVTSIDKTYKTCDSIVLNNEQFISSATDGGGQITIFNCKKNLKKIVEWVGLSYGYRIRTFYSQDNKLIYVTEIHNEFIWNKEKEEYNRNSTRKIYSAFYYVQNNFYHYGTMTYESEHNYRVDPPEPITYVIELIKTNNEYKSKK